MNTQKPAESHWNLKCAVRKNPWGDLSERTIAGKIALSIKGSCVTTLKIIGDRWLLGGWEWGTGIDCHYMEG